jgi:transcriptional regulator with XRE-family HTH domain
MAIKDRIKQLRQEKNWSQTHLAQKIDIHQKQISAYERGRNIPSTEVLIKFAEVFDVSLDYLAFEVEGQSVRVNIKDRELLKRCEEVDKLNSKDKGTIKEIMDSFILKNKFQRLIPSEKEKSLP